MFAILHCNYVIMNGKDEDLKYSGQYLQIGQIIWKLYSKLPDFKQWAMKNRQCISFDT
jgi:hypothetical protein